MYSRNRTRTSSPYPDQIPPSYGGTAFLPTRSATEEIPVRDERRGSPSSARRIPSPPQDESPGSTESPDIEEMPPEAIEEMPLSKTEKAGFSLSGFLSDVGQEEWLLVVLLLLLSGEKDHPIDVIVILLLLLGTQ